MERSEIKKAVINISLTIDKKKSDVTDNIDDILMTPPARENTEIDEDSLYNEDRRDYSYVNGKQIDQIDINNEGIPLSGMSTDRSEYDDDANDRAEVIAALKKIVEAKDSRNTSDDILQISDNEQEPEIMALTERVCDSTDNDGNTTDTYTATPKGDIGLTTGTFPELEVTWNSTLQTNEMMSSRNKTPYTNQYLDSDASVFGTNTEKKEEEIKPERGVQWGSRVEMRSPPKEEHVYEDDYFDDHKSESELQFSRNASRLALESREAMFRRAMSLLSARCTSVKRGDLDKPLPFGYQMPKYFYVTQDKPLPMEPLKAWRGYNGNVYFEPININPVNSDLLNSARAKTSVPRQHEAKTKLTPRAMSEKEARPAPSMPMQVPDGKSLSRQTSKSSLTSQRSSTRQMAILDKQTVLNRLNDSINEDIVWLEGQENTGSLAVRPKTYPNTRSKEQERDLQYNKERIRKGSVVHKLYEEKKSQQRPRLAISGGKFTPPNSLSPLLRTQTQYSLSNNRLTTNSPDPFHSNDSKLPALDQIRASLKHMDNKNITSFPHGKSYNRSLTLTDDMKPFVKYSPDVVAKFAQQTNSC